MNLNRYYKIKDGNERDMWIDIRATVELGELDDWAAYITNIDGEELEISNRLTNAECGEIESMLRREMRNEAADVKGDRDYDAMIDRLIERAR